VVTCDGRLFHRGADATENAPSPTVYCSIRGLIQVANAKPVSIKDNTDEVVRF